MPNRMVTLQERVRLVGSPLPAKGNGALLRGAEIKRLVEEDDSFKQAIVSSGQVVIDNDTQSIKLVEFALEDEEMLIAIVNLLSVK